MARKKMTDHELKFWKDKIDNMSHIEMARLYRSAPFGHPVFRNDLPLFEHFQERFKKLGGMTPEVSKAIGLIFRFSGASAVHD